MGNVGRPIQRAGRAASSKRAGGAGGSARAGWGWRGFAEALEQRLFLDTKILTDLPFYPWFYGCTPTVVGEIMGYYNRTFTNLFPGTDAKTRDATVSALIASTQHQVAGLENGRLTYDGKTAGAGDWQNCKSYPNHQQNPDCIADFLKAVGGNVNMGNVIPGIINFLKFRGYTGWNTSSAFYSPAGFSDVVNSINEGRPVMAIVDLLGEGKAAHSAPIVGYNTANQTFAVVDNSTQGLPGSTYTMQWAHWGPVTVGQRYGILATIQIYPPICSLPFSGPAVTIPATIQAENLQNGLANLGSAFHHAGVSIELTSDTGGGYHVGWTTAGQWMGYKLNVPNTGYYSVDFRLANPGTGGKFHLVLDGAAISGPIAVPNTGSWNTWQTLTVSGIALPAGQHQFKVVFDTASSNGFAGNYNWIQFAPSSIAIPQTPTGVSATDATSADKITVSWNASTGAASYDIFRSTTNDPATAGAAIASSNATFYDDTSAVAGTIYYYWVRANNSAGASGLSTSDAGQRATVVVVTGSTPFSGTPIALPGVIQAENFDLGGEGLAYHDTTAGNAGGAYRTTENVDIEATTDTGGGYNVGWTAPGEWLRYSVNIAATGTYTLDTRLAYNAAGGSYHVEVDGVSVTGAVPVPNTGGWQNWRTVSSTGVTLTAGLHAVKLVIDSGAANFNWLQFTLVSTPTPVPYPDPATPAALPGTIQFENFDTGGEGVAYHDTTPANQGGQYRITEGVDIETATDTGGGYAIDYTAPGEWLGYTINIAAADTYALDVRVASAAAGGQFHLTVDGANVTPSLTVPNTGGWQTWQTMNVDNVSLPAGQHVLKLVMDTAGTSGYVGNFNWMSILPINHPPSFTASDPPATREGTGAVSIPNWSVFSPGPASESAQTCLGYTISNISNPALFAVAPQVDASGTLTYTPAAGISGTSTFTLTTRDSGGTARGGVDTSAAQTFTITLDPVITMAGGVLTLNGTTGADTFTLSTAGGVLSVDVNGYVKTFASAPDQMLVVNPAGGSDVLILDTGSFVMSALPDGMNIKIMAGASLTVG